MSNDEATEIILSDGATSIPFVSSRQDPTVAFGGWEFSDLVDWRGLPEKKTRGEDRPNAHGSFQEERSWRSSRLISWNARFIGASLAQTRDAIDALSALGAELPVTMTVAEGGLATQRLVMVEDVAPLDRRANRYGGISIDVTAEDPRRYAVSGDVPWEVTEAPSAGAGLVWPAVWPLVWPGGGTSGRVTLTNIGRAPSAPAFRLSGGFSSALITCVETGARIGFARPVPVGSQVTISTEDRSARLDGFSDVSRWIRFREWELIPGGQSRTYQFDPVDSAGTPTLEGRVLSAWW